MTQRIVTLPETEWLAFRRQAASVATRGFGSQFQRELLASLGRKLDQAWVKLQPEYADGLNSPEGPHIARPKPPRHWIITIPIAHDGGSLYFTSEGRYSRDGVGAPVFSDENKAAHLLCPGEVWKEVT